MTHVPSRSKQHLRRSPRRLAHLALACAVIATGGTTVAQDFVPGAYLTDAQYDCPPFVFVAMSDSLSRFGTDAAEDAARGGELELGSPGRELWFMDRHRPQPVRLFPLRGHTYPSGLHLPPLLSNGSVHEPTIYHFRDENDREPDRYWVIFSFAIDLATARLQHPCDLFAIDISDAIHSPKSFDADDAPLLSIVRLTDAVGTMTDPQTIAQDVYDRAFNPELAPQFSYLTGVAWQGPGGIDVHFETNTGACVVDEEHGPVLYYVSNRRRTDGQGLLAADLRYENRLLKLLDQREIQHFGTTSMTSLFATPRGAGGSYRSSTESNNQWSVFELRSDEAEWQTISGYANPANFADHNATTINIGDDPDDSLIAISRYYVGNNESFGTIILIPYRDAGRNSDDGHSGIGQVGSFAGGTRNLFRDVDEFQDLPANPRHDPPAPGDGTIGKFAHPAGGRRGSSPSDVELFLTYSPNTSHRRGAYDAKLVAVTDVSAPIAAVNASYLPASPPPGYPVHLVLQHPKKHLFEMKPVLTQSQRFGHSRRGMQPLLARAAFASAPQLDGMPVAQVIAGPIYDTDVRPLARRRIEDAYNDFYDPTTEARNNAGTDTAFSRVACLTKDLASVGLRDVWGVRIYITDAKVRRLMASPRDYYPLLPMTVANPPLWGYLHHDGVGSTEFGAPSHFERFRHLSDVPMDAEGKVNFLLPANVPVKFMLLANDGTVLAAHRNHHSFAPGQIEQRCTGCHQHVNPTPGPATSRSTPFDTVSQTGKWERQANGTMAFHVYPAASLPVPEFRHDIWPLLVSECAICHDSKHPNHPHPTMDGTAKFDLSMPRSVYGPGGKVKLDQEVAVWAWLNTHRIVNRRAGAAKSPLAWYFAGVDSDTAVRLDGETNARYLRKYNPNAKPGSRYWITTDFHGINPHSSSAIADRSKVGKVVEWIDGGAGITHHALNDQLQPDPRRALDGDGYQIGISAQLVAFDDTLLEVGYWDAFENLATIRVRVDGVPLAPYSPSGNGTHVFDLGSHPAPDAVIGVEAIDADGNRSELQKTYRQLLFESEPHRGTVHITAKQRSYVGGETVKFAIAAPAHPGSSHFLLIGEDVYPGVDVRTLDLGLYLLPNAGAWLQGSAGLGAQQPLDGGGLGTATFPLPNGLPPFELYCVSVVLARDGKFAKSNIEPIRIQ